MWVLVYYLVGVLFPKTALSPEEISSKNTIYLPLIQRLSIKELCYGKMSHIEKKIMLWIIACQLSNTNQLLHTPHDTNSTFSLPRPCKSELLYLTLVEWAGFLQFCVVVHTTQSFCEERNNQLDFCILLRNFINSMNVMITFRWSCMWLTGWEEILNILNCV